MSVKRQKSVILKFKAQMITEHFFSKSKADQSKMKNIHILPPINKNLSFSHRAEDISSTRHWLNDVKTLIDVKL